MVRPKQPASLTHEFTYLRGRIPAPHPCNAVASEWSSSEGGARAPGHSTIAVTMDIYSHVTPGMQSEAVAKLDLAFGDHFGDHRRNDAEAAE